MGLFDKKFCDVCGEKIGFLGNRKLEDGNLCKDCARKLSPWFSERRESTVAQIREQLAYREENAAKVAAFHTTRTLGRKTLVCLDEDRQQFLVARTDDLTEENPDVLEYSQVTGADLDIQEHRTEEMREVKDREGHVQRVSYTPPQYRYSYDFYMVIRVDHPWFDEMRFPLNSGSVEVPVVAGRVFPGGASSAAQSSPECREYERLGREIRDVLLSGRKAARDSAAAAAAPKTAVVCPHCGATTLPDASGCCEYCGGAVGV